MKKGDRILREILYRFYEKEKRFMSQKSLAESCNTSIDTANRIINKIHNFRAIEKKPFGFRIVYPKKILFYWACTRDLAKDIIYSTYSPNSMESIENQIPEGDVLTAHSGYRMKFKSRPVHYREVYVYANPREIQNRFPEKDLEKKNLFVLETDPHLKQVSQNGYPPLAQIYVDLWQIGGRAAEKLVIKLMQKLEKTGLRTLESMIIPPQNLRSEK